MENAFKNPPHVSPITKVDAYIVQFISTVFLSEPVQVPLAHVTNMLTINVMENYYKSQYNLQLLEKKESIQLTVHF